MGGETVRVKGGESHSGRQSLQRAEHGPDKIRATVMMLVAVALLSGCTALYTAADLADVLREPTPAERCAQRGEDYVPDVTDPRTGAVVQSGGCRVLQRPTKEGS